MIGQLGVTACVSTPLWQSPPNGKRRGPASSERRLTRRPQRSCGSRGSRTPWRGQHGLERKALEPPRARQRCSEKRGRSKREKEEAEGERRIAERKREREKHAEEAIEDTARKGRGTDMKSQGSRWFFAMKGKRGDHSERGGERRS